MIETTIFTKIIEASPYLGFVLLFIWFEAKREEKRVENASRLETRREEHEKMMQEKQLQQEREVNTLWASYIQQIVNEVKASNLAIIEKMDEHDQKDADRYEKLGITKDLFSRASGRR